MNDADSVRQLWEGWRPPPELERSRPRPVRFTGKGKFTIFIMLALVAGGFTGAVMLYRQAAADRRRDQLLAAAGSEAEARITRLWRSSGKSRRCYVAYQFSSGDAVIGRSASLPCPAWGRLSNGERVRVRYLTGKPEVSRLVGIERSDRVLTWLPPVTAVVLVGVALLIARKLAMERRLLEEGHAAPGLVTKLGIRTDKGRKVHYEFATYAGAGIKGSYGPVHGKDALPVGTHIVVLYDRDDPKRNTRYPPGLVKLDY